MDDVKGPDTPEYFERMVSDYQTQLRRLCCVLLKDAQNISAIANSPWLMIPGLFIIITVMAFNFLGDGLRDAADPYK